MVKSANRIGVLGGTFDPIHNGHIALARAALKQLKLDRVYLVLSPRSPFKLDKPLSPVKVRQAMLEMSLSKEKDILLGDWELSRKGPSYTVKTLIQYKKDHPKDELFLILGSDSLATFRQWKNPDQILKLANLVVGRRPGAAIEMSSLEGQVIFLKGIFPEISSTQIRTDASLGNKVKGVPTGVSDFILKNHLYEQ